MADRGIFRRGRFPARERRNSFLRRWDNRAPAQLTLLCVGKKFCLYYMGNVGDGIVPPKSLNWTHRNHQRIGVAIADSPAGP